MAIRLNVRDQLPQKNDASSEDRTSDPWITNPMLSLMSYTFSLMQVHGSFNWMFTANLVEI